MSLSSISARFLRLRTPHVRLVGREDAGCILAECASGVRRIASAFLILAALIPVARAQQTSASIEEAQGYLQRNAPEYGLVAGDLSELAVTDSYVSRRSGVTYVYFRQQVGGIPVVGGEFTVALDRTGEVVHAAGRGAVLAVQRELAANPAVTATAAAEALARDAGLDPAEPFRVLSRDGGRAPTLTLSRAGVAQEPVRTALVYHLDASGAMALAWEVGLEERAAPHYWLGYVDAVDGRVRARYDLVVHDAFGPAHRDESDGARPAASDENASVPLAAPPDVSVIVEDTRSDGRSALAGTYKVYALPLESPLWATSAPPADARTSVANPDDPTASPFGWHDTDGAPGAEYTVTRGNNVHAYTDVDGNNSPDQGSSPDGGASLAFDFPIDLAQDPSAYRPAAVTNLFYWSNVIHDVLYRYGFDEPAGNFQVNNYGNGGLGGDDVRAEAQDDSNGSGNCNANFFTPSDGSRPRMQMYTCDLISPDSDGDFDNGVIVHEYGHGISNRLTGGPSAASCLVNDEQMGEGWSDFYGLMFSMDAADTRTTLRPIGNYLIGQPQSGGGIRSSPYEPAPGAPYTTDLNVNSATYGATASAGTSGGLTVPHGVGFVWATILWELTWDLIDAHGFDSDFYDAGGTAGNQIALNLVTEAMKLQPCSPGFVDGRDAILAADAALYPDPNSPGLGLHYDTLWQAFARRGLGVSADQGSSSSLTDNVEAFDTPLPPPELGYAPLSVSVALQPEDGTSVSVTLSNTAASGSENLNWTASIQNGTIPTARSQPVRAMRPLDETALMRERKGEDRFAGSGSANLTGGPDSFGYTFADSDEPTGPAVDFQDISGTGTAASWTPTGTFPGGDEGYADVALPFSFPFYGTGRGSVRVFTNGVLTFSAFASDSYDNGSIPSGTTPNAVVAPFWDDLDQSAGGTVYTGTLPDGRFVVQYDAVPRYGQAGSSLTFQVLLSENGTIEVQYAAMTGTLNSATVGIENDTGSDGLPVAVNASYVASNKAVRFAPPVSWVTASPPGGSIAPGGDGTLDVAFDASGLSDGTYTADLVLTTNDPANPSVVIPLQLDVAASLALDVYVMLAGAYDTGSGVMRTDLAAGGHLPLSHPFAARGHAGSEAADPGVITGSDPPVDWVLLHLRDTPGGANVASRAALLLSDGVIVDTDGFSPVAFVGESSGAYFVVVEARNHLAVMSAAAVDLSSGSASYDFRSSLSQAYAGTGSAAMAEAAPGVWALWPGDASGDGLVTAPDFNAWSAATAAAAEGYEASDFNLDGLVTAPDFNLWSAATAAAAATAVPPPGGAVRTAVTR
jgi:hypothetical protein